MTLPRRQLLAPLCLLLLAAPAAAAPPTVTAVTPRGAQPGKAVDLVITGTNLTPRTRLLLPFAAEQKVLPEARPLPTQVRVQLTVDAKVPVGIYVARVLTEDGVSAPVLFAVDAFPNVAEVENNNTFDMAQKVPVPCVVNGQCAGGDVDFYRFTAKKGQSLVIEVQSARLSSGVLPQLRLTDAKQRFLAADDSQALHGDVRLHFVAPADGEYVVEVSDSRFRGAAPPHYRLKIGEYDYADEVFPLGARVGDGHSKPVTFTLYGGALKKPRELRQPMPELSILPFGLDQTRLAVKDVLRPGSDLPEVAVGLYKEMVRAPSGPEVVELQPPMTANGRLTAKGEVHRYQLAAQPGQRYRFTVEAEALGSRLDAVLRVTDQTGKQLATADDVDLLPPAAGLQPFKSLDPMLDFTVPAGVSQLQLAVSDARGRGGINHGYRLSVEPASDDFTLHVALTEINVPRGGWAAVPVTVTRRGYTGPIQLRPYSPVKGFTVQGGYVPANGTAGVLLFGAAANLDSLTAYRLNCLIIGHSPEQYLSWRIFAHNGRPEKMLVRSAEHTLVVARDANVAVATWRLPGLAVGVTTADPVALQPPPSVEVVAGYTVAVPVSFRRLDKRKAAVEVTGVAVVGPPVPGKPPTPSPLTFKPSIAAADADRTAFVLTAAVNAPAGRAADVIVRGKTRVGNADTIVIGPALQVTVKRPVEVLLLTPKLTLTLGQPAVLKGRLDRAAVFKGAVTLKLDGLPKGVTLAKPLAPVPGTQAEFQIELKVDAKTPAAMAKLTLTATATVNGQAFAHPALTVPVEVGKE